MNSYEERQDARRERYLERAEKTRTESREGWQRAREMSEWKTRTTVLRRDNVDVYVMSYKENGWETLFSVDCEKEVPIVIPYTGLNQPGTARRHDKLVHAVELMGYRVISDEIDGKEKAPDAAATAQGADK